MNSNAAAKVAIVDYEMGNLFSVMQACRMVGLDAEISANPKTIAAADLVLLPGIGGFPQAIKNLHDKGLFNVLKDVAAAGKPFVGICLGQQLLMESSDEFGYTAGLGLIAGDVVRLPKAFDSEDRPLKVPHVGWCPIMSEAGGAAWADSPLRGLPNGTEFYFVHSFHVRCKDPADVLAVTPFGAGRYCAAVQHGRVFGFQFHPERSGKAGLHIYRELRALVSGERDTRHG
jgi:glutamine amidotransferase